MTKLSNSPKSWPVKVTAREESIIQAAIEAAGAGCTVCMGCVPCPTCEKIAHRVWSRIEAALKERA